MIVKRLCIVNSNILFEILSELLKEFSFEITSKNLNDLGKQDFEVKGVLYLFDKSEKKLIKQFRPEQILIINKIPIKIEILISQINIQFLKLNFQNQSNIKIKEYSLDLNSKFIKKNLNKLKLTEKEIQIITFLYSSKTPKNVQDLQKNIWNHHEILETHTVETHIYRLRKKIKDEFDDDNFILNSVSGYSL